MVAVQATIRNENAPAFIVHIAPVGFLLMGVFAITLCVFILNDIVNLANLFLKIKHFRLYSTYAAIALSIILSVAAALNFHYLFNIRTINIKVDNLPVDSYKIALIADLHINNYTKPKNIERIFERVEKLKPDLIIIAGDVIDSNILIDDKYKEYGFDKLKAPDGVYAVSGNHEYHTGIEIFYTLCQKLGIRVLNDESILVNDKINLAGINDKNFSNHEMISRSLSKINPHYPTVFISHRPESFDYASSIGRNLVQLSGHTHAGQIPPIWIVRKFFMAYNYGLYNKNENVLYITSGAVGWGPPMRLFNTSEAALIVLENK
jgi:predicted MPP superfamily phosphohydrolase